MKTLSITCKDEIINEALVEGEKMQQIIIIDHGRQRAEFSLAVLKYIGVWQPKSSSGMASVIYNIFSCFVIILTYFFTLTTILYLFCTNYNLEEFTENFFYSLALLSASVKIGNLFIKRSEIIELIEMLFDERFSPRDSVEFKIQTKFDKISRNGTIMFIVLGVSTIILKASGPLTKNNNNAKLPYKAWMPFELEEKLSFWMVYALQAFGSLTAGQATIAIDTFAMTMMLQLCSQLEILKYRMQKYPYCSLEHEIYRDVPRRDNDIGLWVQHHQAVYIFGDKLNDIYWFVFLFQVLVTTLDVCTSSYLLTTLTVTSEQYWTMIFSLMSILFQISLYCWHGSMVIEKSKEMGNAVYMSNWMLLSNNSRINLIQIIRRSAKPIIFNAKWFAPMSIDTLATILRLAYSVYSLLI